MRLVKEIPEVEQKIESGALSLSNITQAANFFREVKRAEPAAALSGDQKREVLAQLEKKSAREGERVLLAISPAAALPRERERVVSLEHTEMRFLVNAELKTEFEKVRSLLGPKGARLSMAELMLKMARLSVENLKEKKFGKRRVQLEQAASSTPPWTDMNTGDTTASANTKARHSDVGEALRHAPVSRSARYIPRAVKHAVWQQGGGKCSCCGSKQNLQYDHVRPVALGGESTPDNLQLLCGSCNLRRGVKTFGAVAMRR